MASKYGLVEGQIVTSNKTGKYRVLSFEPEGKVKLRSLDCGNEVILHRSSASKGTISNKLFPTVFGKGSLGYGKYKSRNGTDEPKNKYYSVWEDMLARCYYPKTSRFSAYGGRGVTVCDEWLNLQNFAKWFEDNYIEGFHLDKDILGDGMQYNPVVCRFIPQEVNGVLVDNTCNRGKDSGLPTGVSKTRGSYQSTLNVTYTNGERFNSTSIKAVMVFYKKNKTRAVHEVLERCKDSMPVDIYNKLKNYSFKYPKEVINEYF